jgi:hypothetical protein
MSELRDRIAAAIDHRCFGCAVDDDACKRCQGLSRSAADAVIAEMGLRQETVGLIHRWVTDWQHDKASYCLRCGIPHTTPCKRGTK